MEINQASLSLHLMHFDDVNNLLTVWGSSEVGVVGVVYVCPYFGKVGNYAFVCVCMCVIDRVYVLCV